MRHRVLVPFVGLLVIFCGFSRLQAKDGVERLCYKPGSELCVEIYRKSGKAAFFLISPYPYEMTATIDLRSFNSNVSHEGPITTSVTNSEKKLFLTVTQKNSHQNWSYRMKQNWRVGTPDAVHDEKFVYALPYNEGKAFSVRKQPRNDKKKSGGQHSVDFLMPRGTPIRSTREGTVIRFQSKIKERGKNSVSKGMGNFIMVRHPDKTIGIYAHLQHEGVFVSVNEKIYKGRTIGSSGCTGGCSDPHLHFEVHRPINAFRRETFPLQFRTKNGIKKELHPNTKYEAEKVD